MNQRNIYRFLTICSSIFILNGCASTMNSTAFENNLENIQGLQKEGELAKASELAQQALDQNKLLLTSEQQQQLEFEIERAVRIRRDYRLTEEELKTAMQHEERGTDDYSEEAFNRWKAEGYFDYRVIDGELRYLNASRPNFFFRHDTVRERRFTIEPTDWETFVFAEAIAVEKESQSLAVPSTNPRSFELTMTISVEPDIVPKGDTIRCWMPFPQEFAYQNNINLISSTPQVLSIASSDYPMRSLYFEAPSNGDEKTVFTAKWTMDRFPQYTNVDNKKVTETISDSAALSFIEEQPPHVFFTEELVALEKLIAGDLTNPAEKARAYYDWIQNNIKYSYAREYSTKYNISGFVNENHYGDCGQISLLFITLCRIGGVPARFSSGWTINPAHVGLHDWAEIYLEPYGWVHVDANWAVFFKREFLDFTAEQKQTLSDFYFGGMDGYRFTANRNHGIAHLPKKQDFRSDTVDFQRGELEANGKNIYFGNFKYSLDINYLDGHSKAVREYIAKD